MKKIWGYVSAFLLGVASAFLLVIKMAKPQQVTNYKIGKVKTKGNANNVAVNQDPNVSSENSEENNNLKSQHKRKIFNRSRKRGIKIKKK